MKVISLLQPWASLVVLGHKKIETRSWNTKYRGDLLIHASAGKKMSKYLLPGHVFFRKFLNHWEDLPYGAIIGKVNLVHTVQFGKNMMDGYDHNGQVWDLSTSEINFGDYSPGRYGWLLSNPVQFTQPIPAKGALGIWKYDMP